VTKLEIYFRKRREKKASCYCRLDLELANRCLGIDDQAMQIMKLHKVNIHDAKAIDSKCNKI
jgi:hypothetical protein